MKTFAFLSGSLSFVRIRRFTCFLICLTVFISLFPFGTSRAEDKIVRVGWYESSFNDTDSFGRRSGYGYEYQLKVAAYTGWKYQYISGSWPELLQMLISGDIDLLSDVSFTPERAESMLFPTLPMGSEDYYLFASPDADISSSDYNTFNGKKIGVNKGSIQADFFREWAERHGVEADLVEVTCSEEESFQKLENGELDAYITVDSFTSEYFVKPEHALPVCKIGSSDFYFAVNKNRPDLLAELETGMNRIQEENRNYNQEMTEKHLVTTGANAFLSPEELAWLEAHGPIRIGYQDQYLAFCASDPQTGELTGALKDYLGIASDCVVNAHIDFVAVPYPTSAAAFEAMKNGEVDCVFPANLSPGDGEEMGIFLTPRLMRTDIFAVVRQKDMQIFSGREYVVVAVNEGNPNYESCLKDHYPSWRTIIYPTTQDCLRAVSSGVADCVLISSYRYNNIARDCEREGLTTVATGIGLDYCFAVPAQKPMLYSVLAKVAKLVPEFSIDSSMSFYIAEDAKSTLWDYISDHPVGITAVSSAILLCILFLLFRSMRSEKKAARLISATETDSLTGLYNREYFLQYADRLIRDHPGKQMDAIVLNIDRFHSVNAQNGRTFGDQLLRALGNGIHTVAEENGGICGRFEADRFDIFCNHTDDYQAIYDRLQPRLDAEASFAGVRLRMGVMPRAVGMDVFQMFDKARIACSMARGNINDHLIVFNEKMQEREDYEQRLLNDLYKALNSFEFEVHYQPQFDIQSDPPKLVSAEALVRWNHPELGIIPPGDFVPLFERHGKISDVDRYVWSEAARQVARWRDLNGKVLPVSVNLSRVDVFDPTLEDTLDHLLSYNGITHDMFRLEVTESAYTGNAGQVVSVVEGLRKKGYVVEMDDFGSGYSSLNMLSAMPVDILKIDREFIRKIDKSKNDSHLVALILGIAKNLRISVVAEGVETEEQLRILRELGCPLVQGFYFSRPLPPDDFESKILRNHPLQN